MGLSRCHQTPPCSWAGAGTAPCPRNALREVVLADASPMPRALRPEASSVGEASHRTTRWPTIFVAVYAVGKAIYRKLVRMDRFQR